jgi:hypothetical protein
MRRTEEEIQGSLLAHSEEQTEAVEDELAENVGGVSEPKPWNVLRDRIKAMMKKEKKVLTMAQINQYLVLVVFANFRLHGVTRTAASDILLCLGGRRVGHGLLVEYAH